MSGPIDLTRLLRDPWSLELFEILTAQKIPSTMMDTSPWLPWSPWLSLVNLVIPVRLVTLISLVILGLGQPGQSGQNGHPIKLTGPSVSPFQDFYLILMILSKVV